MLRFATAAMIAVATAFPASAEPPSQLERTKQLAEVAAQKAEADAKLALRDAERLGKADVPAAIARLKEGLAVVDNERNLAESRRTALTRVFKDRIRVAELGPDSPTEVAAQKKADDARKIRESEIVKAAEANKQVIDGLTNIGKLRKDGKAKEADKAATDLKKKFPDTPIVQLLANQEAFDKAAREHEKTSRDAQQNIVANLRDINKSATPVTDDMTFPADWKERTKNRTIIGAPTPEERNLLRSLDMLVECRYKNSRLQDVLEHISASIGRSIVPDLPASSELGVNYDTPINFTTREPVSARTALRKVLGDLNLAYVVRDGVIHVTTPGKAKDLMTTKVYYLGDLVMGIGPYGGMPTLGINLDSQQLLQNVTAIVEMITGAIDPMSWEKKGGIGHLGVNLPTLSLTVRQSQEVHVLLRSSLYGKK